MKCRMLMLAHQLELVSFVPAAVHSSENSLRDGVMPYWLYTNDLEMVYFLVSNRMHLIL